MTALAENLATSVRAYEPELDANPPRDTERVMTIASATDLWLGELERQGHSERTVDTYRRLLNKLAETDPRADVDELTATHIRRFLDAQARKRNGGRKSAATIAQNVSIMQGFFDFLTKEGKIPRNPTRRNGDRIISRPRQVAPEENDNVVTVSSEDVRRLIAFSNEGTWAEKLAVHCLVYLGPRRRALAQARFGDYDRDDRMLTFREKGGKVIRKPVPDRLADLIEQAADEGVYVDVLDYLIPSTGTRKVERDARVLWRIIRNVADRAGVETHVHALRAAFAVNFLEQNPGQVVALQKLMGHRRIETTMVYLRRMDRQAAMERVRDLSWDEAGV